MSGAPLRRMFAGTEFRPNAPTPLAPQNLSGPHDRPFRDENAYPSPLQLPPLPPGSHVYRDEYQSINMHPTTMPARPIASTSAFTHPGREPSSRNPQSALSLRPSHHLQTLPLRESQHSSVSTDQAGLYLPRSSHFEAQIHSNNQLFMDHVRNLNNQIHELQDEVFRLSGENVAIKTTLDDILTRLDVASDNSAPKTTRKMKGITNQHPELKNSVHAMFWRLVLIDPDAAADVRRAQMTDGHDGDAVYVLIDTPDGSKSKVWKPNYALAVNTKKNKQFIAELVERVYETETQHRKKNEAKLPNASYEKDIIKSLAQTYFSTIATTWKKMGTPEGKKKLEDEAERKKLRNRRETVTAARRDVVADFETTYEVSGAAALLDTDFASSIVSLDEELISEATRERRKQQGGREGDWMYLRFLRELDRFIKLKAAAIKKKKINDKKQTTEPPKKKRRANPKQSTRRFHAAQNKASDRPPNSTKNIIPIAGMVKKSWQARQSEKVDTLPTPDWWKSWADDAAELETDVQELLDELSSDTLTESE
ncbi:hypothetical protein B0H13DRAFT_2510066 [Mycena leptocephala]|nr:hypothetical protein B0H13DRAFT_2510066 [Mycena leptocephala]